MMHQPDFSTDGSQDRILYIYSKNMKEMLRQKNHGGPNTAKDP